MTLDQISNLTSAIEQLVAHDSSISQALDGDRKSLVISGSHEVHHQAARDFTQIMTLILDADSGLPGAERLSLVADQLRAPNADNAWQIVIGW